MTESEIFELAKRYYKLNAELNDLEKEHSTLRQKIIDYLTREFINTRIAGDFRITIHKNKRESISSVLAKKFLSPDDLLQITTESETKTLKVQPIFHRQ